MTKLFEAYKKRSLGKPDLPFDLSTLGEVVLFPNPTRQQQEEMASLSSMLLEYESSVTHGVVICFASSMPQEGASYISYHAARILAHGFNRRVAWIDANYQSPQRKLSSLGEVTLTDMLQNPDQVEALLSGTNLVLVPGGSKVDRRIAQASPTLLKDLHRRLAGAFDFTIIDCPPILKAVETAQLAAAFDGTVVVVARKQLKRDVVRRGLDTLAAKKAKVLGAVFNRRVYELPKIIYDRL
jgi:Mrp family chromosome partitioning ATPase